MGKPGSLIPPVHTLTTTRVRNVPPFSSTALLRQACAVVTSSPFGLPVLQCLPLLAGRSVCTSVHYLGLHQSLKLAFTPAK